MSSTSDPNPSPPLLYKSSPIWSDQRFDTTQPLKDEVFHSLYTPNFDSQSKTLTLVPKIDRTLLLSDELLLRILSKLPHSQRNPNFLVCKRWLYLQGRLVSSLRVLDWEFIESGRLTSRFTNLTHVDVINGCIVTPYDSSVCFSHRFLSMHLNSEITGLVPVWRICEANLLPVEVVDKGLKKLASACPNLCKLVVIGAGELGLLGMAEKCPTLQELELHKCDDNVLRGIAACENLQILKLVGNVSGLYSSIVSDIGLTILAQGCKRLVKLELSGCEGSFDGIKAIGHCCQMLEELTLSDHRMDDGWISALSYCENLKSLRFLSCKKIDLNPGPDDYLGSCPTLERLHLHKCLLKDKLGTRALFKVCQAVREIVVQDCWRLDDELFSFASACRRVKLLSLEGCPSLTTNGLEVVLVSYNELQQLRVESCKHIKEYEVSPALSTIFSVLKELKWRPDGKALLEPSLEGTGMGLKGSKFFKKSMVP